MICSADNCESETYCKGYCIKHYSQFKKYGKIYKSRQEFNDVVDKGSYLELVLTNVNHEVSGKAKIDKEDLEKVRKVGRWRLSTHGYVIHRKKGKTFLLHRVVTDAKSNQQVDHKKTGLKGKLDNRKKKLRFCTTSQNGCNRGKPKHNTSGYKGVSYRKRDSLWKAEICVEGKRIWLGSYDTPKEAAKAYDKASKKYHKEFSYRK